MEPLETFAFGDRAAALARMLPGTEQELYHRALDCQHRGALAEARDLAQRFRERFGASERWRRLDTRQRLLEGAEDLDEARRWLTRELGLRFDHAPDGEAEARARSLPTRLDEALVSEEAFLRGALSGRSGLGEVEDAALYRIPRAALSATQRADLVKRLALPDRADTVELVLEDLAERKGARFGDRPVHARLTLAQLDALFAARPALVGDAAFLRTRLARLAPGPDEAAEHPGPARAAWIHRLLAATDALGVAYGGLRAYVLAHAIAHDLQQGRVRAERLVAFLALPHQAPFARALPSGRLRVQVSSEDASAIGLGPMPDANDLVLRAVDRLLQDAPDLATTDLGGAAKHLEAGWLATQRATAGLLYGHGDPDAWTAALDADAARALAERVEVAFDPAMPRLFAADEQVDLVACVKNVDALTVRIYALDLRAILRETSKEPDLAIDLDGLLPNDERAFPYEEPPHRRVRRSFALPELAGAGAWVVELVGGGRRCRALVRKGSLSVVERWGPAGRVLGAFDEAGRPERDLRVEVGGRVYEADEHGEVLLAWPASPVAGTAVAWAAARAALVPLAARVEHYELDARFHLEPESTAVEGREATLLARVALTLHGVPAPVELLEDVSVFLSTTDAQGVEAERRIDGVRFTSDADLAVPVPVGPSLRSLRVRLAASVKRRSGAPQQFSAEEMFALATRDDTCQTAFLYLERTSAGYAVRLLGRAGEPRAGRPVQLTLSRAGYGVTIDQTLATDDAGAIALGALSGVSELEVSIDGDQRTFVLAAAPPPRPSVVHLREGEAVRFAWATGRAPARGEVALLERSGDGYRADHFAALRQEPGALVVRGLPPGEHDLVLRDEAATVRVIVAPKAGAAGAAGAADAGARWMLTPVRALERLPLRGLAIAALTASAEAVEVALTGVSPRTRVHVVASRFAPPDGRDFAAVAGAGPRRPHARALADALSLYSEGLELGEEQRYVLERRAAARVPGSLLDRPGMLVHPWEVGEAETRVRDARPGDAMVGGAYGRSARGVTAESAAYCASPAGPDRSALGFGFLARGATVLANLRPDEGGRVRIPRGEIAHANLVRIVVLDGQESASGALALDAVEGGVRDRRLLVGFDPAAPVAERRLVTGLAVGERLEINDLATAEVEAVVTIADAFGLLCALAGDAQSDGGRLDKLAWLARWHALSDAERLEKLDEFACHEAHLFVRKKDPAFFDRAIRPHLACKLERTFLDRWLLDEPLDAYLEPWAFARLNPLEKALLAERADPERREGIAQHLDELAREARLDVQELARRFDAALSRGALEGGDGLGIREAQEQAKEERAERRKKSAGRPPMPKAMASRARASGLTHGLTFGAGFADAECEEAGDMPPPPAAMAPPAPAPPPPPPGGGFDDLDLGLAQMDRRDEGPPPYTPLGRTKVWAEQGWYKRRTFEVRPDLVGAAAIWPAYVRHVAAARSRPFLPAGLHELGGGAPEVFGALALTDLAFEAPRPQVDVDGARLTLTASAAPAIVYHKEVRSAPLAEGGPRVLLSQGFVREDEPYQLEDGEEVERWVEGALRPEVAYRARVVVTNPTQRTERLDVLLQVPEGAVAIGGSAPTRSVPMRLGAYETETETYAFYFPTPGQFAHFPAHVARDEALVAHAPAREVEVSADARQADAGSFEDISQRGTAEEVLAFLRAKPLRGLALDRIAWRMRDRAFYEPAIAILERRGCYTRTLWSYALVHGDRARIGTFVRQEDALSRRAGVALDGGLAPLAPQPRGLYEHLDFAPLVPARAHRLGQRHEVANLGLARQWAELLTFLGERASPSTDERVAAAAYLVAQDRLEDARALLSTIAAGQGIGHTVVQADYLRCYLALRSESPASARAIAERYRAWPALRWRRRFEAVLDVLDEASEAGPSEADRAGVDARDDTPREARHARAAAAEPWLEADVEPGGQALLVRYRHLAQLTLRAVRLDLELLFSRAPFVAAGGAGFGRTAPHAEEVVGLPEGLEEHRVMLPESVRGANLLVSLEGGGRRVVRPVIAGSLRCEVAEPYGIVRVRTRGDLAKVAAAYVKVYARDAAGRVRFHKDGYTDLAGRFDYASVSADPPPQVRRFAILVLHDRLGGAILEAAPPG